MGNTKPAIVAGKTRQKDILVVRRSHYRRLLRRIEDLEDALTLDRAESNSKNLIEYSEVHKRLKRAGKW